MSDYSNKLKSMSDHELVELCLVRPVDDDAWSAFYERFEDLVRWGVIGILKTPSADVKDVMQECFARIFEILPEYDASKSSVRTYLSRVVTHLSIDYVRHGAKLRSITSSINVEMSALRVRAGSNPEQLRIAAVRIVDEIEDKRLAAICGALLQGDSAKEIEAKYDIKIGKVYAAGKWFRKRIKEVAATLPNS